MTLPTKFESEHVLGDSFQYLLNINSNNTLIMDTKPDSETISNNIKSNIHYSGYSLLTHIKSILAHVSCIDFLKFIQKEFVNLYINACDVFLSL